MMHELREGRAFSGVPREDSPQIGREGDILAAITDLSIQRVQYMVVGSPGAPFLVHALFHRFLDIPVLSAWGLS